MGRPSNAKRTAPIPTFPSTEEPGPSGQRVIMKNRPESRDEGEQMKRSSPTRFHPVSERLAFGQDRRKALKRVGLGEWKPANSRPDPVALLVAADRGRLPHLLRIKYDRMAACL